MGKLRAHLWCWDHLKHGFPRMKYCPYVSLLFVFFYSWCLTSAFLALQLYLSSSCKWEETRKKRCVCVCIFQLEKPLLLNLPIGYTRGFLASEHDRCVSFKKFWTQFPCPSHQHLSAQELRMWHRDCNESSSGMHYPWAHPCMNPSKKRKGLKSNKIPLSSCSEDTVLTNSPQKARSCNLLLRRGWEAGSQVPVISVCEAQAGKHEKSHRRCPFECLENVEPPATLCWGKSQL